MTTFSSHGRKTMPNKDHLKMMEKIKKRLDQEEKVFKSGRRKDHPMVRYNDFRHLLRAVIAIGAALQELKSPIRHSLRQRQ
jgi:hypothetical protein